ncbi:MAG TPA: hypothetical protein PLQ71_23465, partial [Nitrospira sp.]|nr:hypothetical protein [Nitrospira sp.]
GFACEVGCWRRGMDGDHSHSMINWSLKAAWILGFMQCFNFYTVKVTDKTKSTRIVGHQAKR